LTGKVHPSADRRCRPLSFVLTRGQAADSLRFTAVLERIKVRGPVGRPRTRPAAVKEWRGLANRYDRTPVGYFAGLHLRGAVIRLRSVSRTLCVPVVSRLFGRGVAVCGRCPVVRTSG
jgi:hypothetical protein